MCLVVQNARVRKVLLDFCRLKCVSPCFPVVFFRLLPCILLLIEVLLLDLLRSSLTLILRFEVFQTNLNNNLR